MATAAIETTDWLALKSRVDSLVTDPVLPVFEPGEVIPTPAMLRPLLLISDVRNDPDRGGRIDPALHVRSGTLMITVRWPLALAISHAQLVQIGGSIAGHFTADVCMHYGTSRLRVTEDAAMRQPYVDGAYRYVPVTVSWSSL